MSDEVKKSLDFWNELHLNHEKKDIIYDDWLEMFDDLISKCNTPIIDLGCGNGNDTLYLIGKGKKVIACDQSENAIKNIKRNFPEIYDTKIFNMLDGFPFDDNSFELIIADLCLHYFRSDDTFKILKSIKKILKDDGHLLFRINSINDVNYGAGKGEEIEHHLYLTDDGMYKRFFDNEDVKKFFSDFHIEYLNEESMNRYKYEKKVYRGCVRKKSFDK